jgi:hypothetical protein
MAEHRRRGRSSRMWWACLSGIVLISAGLAGCTSSLSSSSPSSNASSVAGEFSDANLVESLTVPAGGSLDVPLVFEGASTALLSVYGASDSISASFGGTEFGPMGSGATRVLSLTVANPSDGPLHLTNAGSSQSSVWVSVQIPTDRHLSITAPTGTLAIGSMVSFEIDLSEATADDSVQAEYVSPSGTHTPLTLAETAQGRWTGSITPAEGGNGTISAWTTTGGKRYASARLWVAGGAVSLSSTFTEGLADTNNDGLADALVVTPTVTISAPGEYIVRATLADAAGNPIAQASGADTDSGYYQLVAGSQSLDISFSGASIYKSGTSGPYHVTDITVSRVADGTTYPELTGASLGPTSAYDYHAFQH